LAGVYHARGELLLSTRHPAASISPAGSITYKNFTNAGYTQGGASFPAFVAQTDYAGNMGCTEPAGVASSGSWPTNPWGPDNILQYDAKYLGGVCCQGTVCRCSGVICAYGEIRLRDIKDGTSRTYLAGEKYVSPDAYLTGQDSGADQCWDEGLDDDVNRCTSWKNRQRTELWGRRHGQLGPTKNWATAFYWPPMQDQPGVYGGGSYSYIFGSAHPNSFNMVFCDGSVQALLIRSARSFTTTWAEETTAATSTSTSCTERFSKSEEPPAKPQASVVNRSKR